MLRNCIFDDRHFLTALHVPANITSGNAFKLYYELQFIFQPSWCDEDSEGGGST